MSQRHGWLAVIGIGPGDKDCMTVEAIKTLTESEVVVGYRPYLTQIKDLLDGKEVHAFGMRQEMARAELAVDLACRGKRVALISSGDPGVYGMAGPALEAAAPRQRRPNIRIVPGVTAMSWAAARLGAPLMHDVAAVSLSDLLTPWEAIERRLDAAAAADFVIVLYNPRSKRRTWQLDAARRIILRHRDPETPVGLVHKGDPPQLQRSSLARLATADVDMNAILIVGNSTTRVAGDWLITPRGYKP